MAKFDFNRDFQISLLGLVFQNWDFLVFSVDLIKPEYFEDKILVWFYQTITQHYKNYNEKPTPVVVENELEKAIDRKKIRDEERDEYFKVFDRLQQRVVEKDYIRDEVVRFCKRQEVRNTILDVVSWTNSEDPQVWDNIVRKITDACGVGTDTLDLGIQYFEDYVERIRQRLNGDDRIIVPTGITELDDALAGGAKAGQLFLWVGGTGRGKSFALVQCGKRAVVERRKVVHYTLELGAEEVAERYDAAWTGIPLQEIEDNTVKLRSKLERLGNKYGNSLIIKKYPTKGATVYTLEGHLRQLINTGFYPDLIIVDYLDLLSPTTNYQSSYEDLGDISGRLRGLGDKFGVPIQTATQANRAGNNVEVADRSHISDSLQKAFIADIIAVICMNKEEKADNRARIFLDKSRNGPDGFEIKIKTAYARGVFYDPLGLAVEREVEPPKRREPKPKRRRPANDSND